MSTHIASVPEGVAWKRAYLAAILEKDRNRITGLIQDARSKLSVRLEELAGDFFSYDEIEAIHDADYLLQALQSSLSYRTDLQN
ncbi:MAG TPA: hypothetical protein VMG82_38025 [Candidatus Sulfotelmatobacter sp.]|nr:hypothetical protein [Candidatus Sulfotelmatobacter sp.]